MTYAMRAYTNRVNRITSGEEPICFCAACKDPMYYMGKAYKVQPDEIYCDLCFADYVADQYEVTLDDEYIDEPDWDSMPGGHDSDV